MSVEPVRVGQAASTVGARGFTLIELILVMAMLLTVLSLAAPALVRFFRGRNLEGEARRLLAVTRYGQSRAVSEGVPMLLWLNVESNQYGLRIDPSFAIQDTNALQFDWNERIQIEAGLAESATNLRPWQVSSLLSDRMVKICFLPDGSISDISPSRLRLQELREQGEPAAEIDGEIWITQSPNRLRYEIPAEPPPEVRR
jgi:prepilin-type N-terminal cleavage/methylation domain-containing protein